MPNPLLDPLQRELLMRIMSQNQNQTLTPHFDPNNDRARPTMPPMVSGFGNGLLEKAAYRYGLDPMKTSELEVLSRLRSRTPSEVYSDSHGSINSDVQIPSAKGK